MPKSQMKVVIVSGLAVICGVTLGIYMIPFFLAIFLGGLLHVPLDGLEGYTQLLLVQLGNSMAEAAAFGVSGFLMALLISCFSRSREIRATLFGVLIVGVFYAILECMSIMPSKDPIYASYMILESVLSVIFLLFFAFLGAWLITKRRRAKVQKSVECGINAEAGE